MTRRTSSGALLAVARSTDATVRSNVRAPLDTFVGRAAEIDRVRALLIDEGARLVTVLGVAGAGKTRLARAVALGCLGSPASSPFDEVWWIELGAAQSRAQMLAEIGRRLDVEAGHGDEAATLDHLGRVLSSRGRVLLVLDELDELAEHADLLVELLSRTASTRVLVSSRIAGEVTGEHRVEVGALTERDAAVELFVARARPRCPHLDPDDPATRASIGEVVELLERLPLSLELAASLLSLYDVRSLAQRLAISQDVLRASDAERDPRHRSLYRALRSSWERLDEATRRALACCTVFDGTFDALAAEAVIGAGVEGIDQLTTLVASSLVQREVGDEGRTRLRLFRAVRGFVGEIGDADAIDEARRRHLRHYAGRARGWVEELAAGAERPELGRDIAAERANLRAAIATALAAPHPLTEALLCCCALAVDVRKREGVQQLASLVDPVLAEVAGRVDGVELPRRLTAPRADLDVDVLVEALGDSAAGMVCELMLLIGATHVASARRDEATAWLTVADRLADRLGDDVRQGRAAFERALDLRATRALDESQAETGRASAHFERGASRPWLVRARTMVALLCQTRGELAEAEQRFLETLVEAEALGLEVLAAFVEGQLASIAWHRGRIAEARHRLSAALTVQLRAGETRQAATTYAGLTMFGIDLGEIDEARTHNEHALELHGQLGQTVPLAISHVHRVWLETQAGDLDTARDYLLRLRGLLGPAVDRRHAVWLCRAEVYLAVNSGDLASARTCLESVLPQVTSIAPRDRCEVHFLELALAGLMQRADEAAAYLASIEVLDASTLSHNSRALCALAPAYGVLARQPLDALDEAAATTVVEAFASAFTSDGPQASVRESFRLRVWIDHLERTLPDALRARAWAAALDPQRSAIVVAPAQELVQLPGGELSDLGRRRTVARVLWALIDHARTAPRESVLDHDALLAAGWPGERILPEAALNRLHKTLSMVRKLGLRDQVELVDDGYRLSPELEILEVPASFAAWWKDDRARRKNAVTAGLRALEGPGIALSVSEL